MQKSERENGEEWGIKAQQEQKNENNIITSFHITNPRFNGYPLLRYWQIRKNERLSGRKENYNGMCDDGKLWRIGRGAEK